MTSRPKLAPSRRGRSAPDPEGDHTRATPCEGKRRRPRLAALLLRAVGVVFGDIGTSPLYALQTVFSAEHNAVTPSREDVFGVISMVFWAPAAAANPFFLMAPGWGRLPLVLLATMATIIASQAVISGAFSVSRQAVRAGLLPHLRIVHTSQEEGGQIYIASINWILFTGVLVLIAVFRSPQGLASAYGLAVTGTLLLEMTIFLLLSRYAWRVAGWKIALAAVLILGVEVVFLLANLAKLFHGGWLPLLIAGAVVLLMITWRQGSAAVVARRREIEGPLSEFIEKVRADAVPRVPRSRGVPAPEQDHRAARPASKC